MDILLDYELHEIRLTEERWQHILEHPEMSGTRQAREETLRAPEIVVQSIGDPQAKLYYRFQSRTLVSGKYLCVVVKMRALTHSS